jgi:hydrogenase maturation protease
VSGTGSRILVAGVGNIFLADDGFGVEVAQRLLACPLPEGTKLMDVGIRGLHLAYELLDGYDLLVLVDALPLDEEAGTVVVFEPDLDQLPAGGMDAHGMDPQTVLALLRSLGGEVGRVLVVGCQPADLDERIGLSAPVAAAVDEAVAAVLRLVRPGGASVPASRTSRTATLERTEP